MHLLARGLEEGVRPYLGSHPGCGLQTPEADLAVRLLHARHDGQEVEALHRETLACHLVHTLACDLEIGQTIVRHTLEADRRELVDGPGHHADAVLLRVASVQTV
jgi:hypothetical protein